MAKASTSEDFVGRPAAQQPGAVAALDRLAQGDWQGAHRLVQNEPGADAAWVHAHLHRAEGDLANAAYWYRRARKPLAEGPLAAERAAIRAALTA